MSLIAHPHFGQHCHFNRIDFSDLWYLWPSRDTTNQSFFIGTDGRKEKGSTEKASVIQHWSTYSTTAPNFAPGLYHALLWLRSGESILLLVHFAPFPCCFGSSITCLMSPIWTIYENITSLMRTDPSVHVPCILSSWLDSHSRSSAILTCEFGQA